MQNTENPNPPLRSRESRLWSFVRFQNRTERKVDVVWINFDGVRVKYKTLEPGESFDVNTYVSHPWVFLDSLTHERMTVKSKSVFEPFPWFEPHRREIQAGRVRINQLQPQRIPIFITIPLYTLRERALQAVRRLLPRPELAYELELPRDLQIELAKPPQN